MEKEKVREAFIEVNKDIEKFKERIKNSYKDFEDLNDQYQEVENLLQGFIKSDTPVTIKRCDNNDRIVIDKYQHKYFLKLQIKKVGQIWY